MPLICSHPSAVLFFFSVVFWHNRSFLLIIIHILVAAVSSKYLLGIFIYEEEVFDKRRSEIKFANMSKNVCDMNY